MTDTKTDLVDDSLERERIYLKNMLESAIESGHAVREVRVQSMLNKVSDPRKHSEGRTLAFARRMKPPDATETIVSLMINIQNLMDKNNSPEKTADELNIAGTLGINRKKWTAASIRKFCKENMRDEVYVKELCKTAEICLGNVSARGTSYGKIAIKLNAAGLKTFCQARRRFWSEDTVKKFMMDSIPFLYLKALHKKSEEVLLLIKDMKKKGMSLEDISDELNKTICGDWQVSTVRNLPETVKKYAEKIKGAL